MGWGLAVTLGVYASSKFSGAHINPEVTLGFLSIGEIESSVAINYILGQSMGAFVACIVIYLHYCLLINNNNIKIILCLF